MKAEPRHLPIGWIIPNLVTIMALCSGLNAMRHAFNERWELAFTFVAIAGVLDGMDGRLARMLKASSTFGAQLDSLADFLSFGVAPVVVLYLWHMQEVKGFGWAVVMIYAICCALRLARFNTALFEPASKRSDRFFTGIPAPVGAGLSLFPMIITFQFGPGLVDNPWIVMANALLISALMISRIPTLSIKKLRVSVDMAVPFMVVCALFVAMLIVEPWLTLIVISLGYYLTIPITTLQYLVAKRRDAAGEEQPVIPAGE